MHSSCCSGSARQNASGRRKCNTRRTRDGCISPAPITTSLRVFGLSQVLHLSTRVHSVFFNKLDSAPPLSLVLQSPKTCVLCPCLLYRSSFEDETPLANSIAEKRREWIMRSQHEILRGGDFQGYCSREKNYTQSRLITMTKSRPFLLMNAAVN